MTKRECYFQVALARLQRQDHINRDLETKAARSLSGAVAILGAAYVVLRLPAGLLHPLACRADPRRPVRHRRRLSLRHRDRHRRHARPRRLGSAHQPGPRLHLGPDRYLSSTGGGGTTAAGTAVLSTAGNDVYQ